MAAQLWQEIGDAEPTQGLTMTTLLAVPDKLRDFLAWMVRRYTVPLKDVCDHLEQEEDVCRQLLVGLQDKGLVRLVDHGNETRYGVWLVTERSRSTPSPVWRA